MIQVFLLACGVLSAGLGIEAFLVPAGFIDGGVTGVSMLLWHLTGLSLPLLLLLMNLPFLALGYVQVGSRFAWTSAAGITGVALAIHFIPYPHITQDRLLAAVFGGIFLGGGIGLSIRGGGVLDGTEILGLLISRRIGTTVGDIVLAMNIIIFAAAAWFLGPEAALYSVLTYASAARSVDFLLHGIEEYYSLLIISDRSTEIRDAVITKLGRSLTRLKGSFGRSDEPREVILSVLTRLELGTVRSLILEIDPRAFIVVLPVRDVSGGVVKARPIERLVPHG